jgi:hypothetical protein
MDQFDLVRVKGTQLIGWIMIFFKKMDNNIVQ